MRGVFRNGVELMKDRWQEGLLLLVVLALLLVAIGQKFF